MLLMIDNYDSFTYNLVQYFGELGEEVWVYRNDQIDPDQIAGYAPARIVLSPGPCTPTKRASHWPPSNASPARSRSWASAWAIRASAKLSAAIIVRAGHVMHGKTSEVHHRGKAYSPACPVRSPWCAIIPW